MRFLPYTFRTFPENLLIKYGLSDTFRFGNLHQDLKTFENLIQSSNPDIIIGFSIGKTSRQELVAINQFNNGVINKFGKNKIRLAQIDKSPFMESEKPTFTFCNWTMYKLAQNHPVSFHHIREEDFDKFIDFLKRLPY